MPDARDLPVPGARAESHRPAPHRTGECAQPPADAEQLLARDERALSDTDQARSARDQARSAISDRHLANGGDPVAHAFSRDIRQGATREREQTSRARLLAAAQRDEISRIRDLTLGVHDRAVGRRDAPRARHATDSTIRAAGPLLPGARRAAPNEIRMGKDFR
jgi:hypothetical protein